MPYIYIKAFFGTCEAWHFGDIHFGSEDEVAATWIPRQHGRLRLCREDVVTTNRLHSKAFFGLQCQLLKDRCSPRH